MADHHRDSMHLQIASGKVPPSWGPDQEHKYSFKSWQADLELWQLATDLDTAKQAAAVALRLTGAAKEIGRSMPTAILANGVFVTDAAGQIVLDQQTGQPILLRTGLQQLLRELQRRFAPLQQETQLKAISEVMNFRRWQSEPIDEVVSRFEISVCEADNTGGVQLNEVVLS